MNTEYYTVSDVENDRFYKLPKALIENPKYDSLSASAKIVFAILKDRHSLSVTNGWVDEKGVFFIYKDKDLAKLLKLTERTLRRIKADLKKHGLIDMIQAGKNLPNKIYLLKPQGVLKKKPSPFDSQGQDKNVLSGADKNVLSEQDKNVLHNETNIIKTEINKTNHHPIEGFKEKQSELIHQFLKENKIDDDMKYKLLERLKGRNFKYISYIKRTYETLVNSIETSKPIKREIVPDRLKDDYKPSGQPEMSEEEFKSELERLKQQRERLKQQSEQMKKDK